MTDKPEQSWDNATWSGSRRTMIRQSLKLSVRQRLQALEDLCATSQTLANIKEARRIHEQAGGYTPPATAPDDKK